MNDNKLLSVSKPARYIGGELNAVYKKNSSQLYNFCLIFPDIYEIGSSHIGYRLLYSIINSSDKLSCERFFAPWMDALNQFGGEIFYSLESRKKLKEFDAIGFSISYELSYTTLLRILKSSEIPLYSSERIDDNSPIVMAGGGAVYNPQPIVDFIDVFYIGEGDDNIVEVLEFMKTLKDDGFKKIEILKKINERYPFLYLPLIDKDKIVKRAISLTFATERREIKPIVPIMEAVQDRVAVEIARGCTAGCRFCQAGMIYRPVRERSPQMIIDDAVSQIKATGHSEVSLLSLSTGDYLQIAPLVNELSKKLEPLNVSLSTPSLRADSVTEELFKEITKVRKSGFTIAPEAGSERLRRVINKNLTEEDILNSVAIADANGIRAAKLYFMIGLPTETDEDVLDIIKLADKIKHRVNRKTFNITIAVSHFVPKAHTVFERFGQVSFAELYRKVGLLREAIKGRNYRLKYHDLKTSKIEALLSRGDSSVGKLLVKLMEEGAYLDAWGDFFDYDKWLSSADQMGFDIFKLSDKTYAENENLVWSNIDTGVSEDFKRRELEKAITETMIDDCRFGNCFACGVCNYDTIDVVNAEDDTEKQQIEKQEFDRAKFYNYMVIYEKTGQSKFLSALESNRLIAHSLIVMGVDIRYTEGFNPTPRILLVLPLPVGMEGVNEILLFRSGSERADDFIERFNKVLPSGYKALSIKEVASLKIGMQFISEYKLEGESKTLFEKIMQDNSLYYERRDKTTGSMKRIELARYFVSYKNGVVTIRADESGSFNLIEFLKFHGQEHTTIAVIRTTLSIENAQKLGV